MPTLWQRLKVVCIGTCVGAALAWAWCMSELPPSMPYAERAKAWAAIMTGPVFAFYLGMHAFGSFPCVGFLASPMILAHPARPNTATGFLTALGLLVWFGTGWLTIVICVWGA